MIDLTNKLKEQFKEKERDPKRVSVSQVHAMLNNWDNRPPDFQAMLRMWQGTFKHEAIQKLLPEYQHEIKKEYTYKDWKLVGMVDCINDEHILEIKTSEDVFEKAKEWHVTQAKLYCSMFERDFCYIVQPVFTGNKLYLKRLRKVGRNDEWFNNTLEEINNKLYGKI